VQRLRHLAPCLVATALLALAPATARAAPPIVAVGDQHAAMFSDPHWRALHLTDTRYVAPWDVLQSPRNLAALDAYLAAANAANVRVLLSLGHASTRRLRKVLPSVARYARVFRAIHARYPWLTDYEVWNEENLCSQPTCRHPARAARYYNAVRNVCWDCRVVGADLLYTATVGAWARRFRQVAKGPLIWGLHNYIDANRFRETGTKALLKATPGDAIWFTETGGLVTRRNGSTIAFPGSISHAAKATGWVFKLAALSSRVKRIYFYQWEPVATPDPTWDSALLNKYDKPRPAYKVLKAWLRKHDAS
jgi:hypothetical protein